MKKKIILVLFLAILSIPVFCQKQIKDTVKYKINEPGIYGGLGITPFFSSITANFEIMLRERPNKVFKKQGLRIGSGVYQYYADGSLNVIISYACLTGAENNHFESGLGISYMHFLSTSGRYIAPAPNIGYRYQKPEGNFTFRTGIGFPELLYLSFGYVFN